MSAHRIEIEDLLSLRRHAGAVDLSSRRRVMADFSGSYLSGFRGRGMEFEEHRVYQAGDEVRTMDWRVTARTGVPHVRLYREERERPVILVADLRPPMWFGTRGCFKAVLAARATALCAWSALDNGDRIGGLCFGSGGHFEFRPAGGRRGALQLMHALEAYQANAGTAAADATAATGFAEPLQKLLRTARTGSLVAIFSDFRGLQSAERDLLRRLARRVELIIGFVHDPLESALPPPGRYPVISQQGREPAIIDSSIASLRARWAQGYEARRKLVAELSREMRAHWLDLNTAVAVQDSFIAAFGRRRIAG